jgi:hypothetical protein
LFRRVVSGLEAFGFGKDAKKCGIASGYPTAESEPARKEQQPGDQTVEQVEGADSSDTNEEEQRAFHSEVREGLVQTLIDPVQASIMSMCLHLCLT